MWYDKPTPGNLDKPVVILLGILVLAIALNFMLGGSAKEVPKNSDGTPKTERQIKVESQFSSWDGSHPGLERLIKDNMNDPDSYEHIETRILDKGSYIFVITKFRGANAFGGKVVNTISAKVDFNGNVLEIVK